MSKIIILGDTHLGASKSSDKLHDYFEKFYSFMFSYMNQHGIEQIVQTGDLYDYRREVHFNTIYRSNQYLFSKTKNLIIISGNHDCLYKNTNKVNSVRSLRNNDSTIIDLVPETYTVGGADIDFYPWINETNIEMCFQFASTSTSKWAVGHFEFANFPLYPGTNADHGMDHKLFSRYDRVFSGHYHTRSEKDNVMYIGTPYELTWGDCYDPKGFTVFDPVTGTIEFIQNPHTLFSKVNYVEGTDVNEESIKDHYVKIIVSDKPNQKKFDSFVDSVRKCKPHDVKIIESSIIEAVSEAVNSTSVDVISTKNVIQSVVDNMATPLDRTRLMNKIMSVYTEAEQVMNV